MNHKNRSLVFLVLLVKIKSCGETKCESSLREVFEKFREKLLKSSDD